jgi:hypothetical protein
VGTASSAIAFDDVVQRQFEGYALNNIVVEAGACEKFTE